MKFTNLDRSQFVQESQAINRLSGMNPVLLVLLTSITSLLAFDVRSDIDQAFRHRKWAEVERLTVAILKTNGHRHRENPDAGTLCYRLGIALWHQGKWKRAAELFEKVHLGKQPTPFSSDKLQALLGWSDCAYRLGDYGTSIRLAKRFHRMATVRDWHRKSPYANGPEISGYNPYFGETLPTFPWSSRPSPADHWPPKEKNRRD